MLELLEPQTNFNIQLKIKQSAMKSVEMCVLSYFINATNFQLNIGLHSTET